MSKKNTMITNFFRTSKSGVQNTNFSNNKSTFSTLQDSTKLSDVNKKYDNSSSSSSANSKTVSLKRKNNEITLSQSTDIQYNNDNVTNKKSKTFSAPAPPESRRTEPKKTSNKQLTLVKKLHQLQGKIENLREERKQMEETSNVESEVDLNKELDNINQWIRESLLERNKIKEQYNKLFGEKKEDGLNIQKEKVMLCNVHGRIKIPGACIEMIDSPQFQRLRYLKQLGLCYYVYPTACHNRFEHSIGVMHLAGKLVHGVLDRQPYLKSRVNITDILCVQLAGLCHDLGHGPFSHVFDNVLLKRLDPNSNWTHEDAGCDIIDYMISNEIVDLEKYGINHDDDVSFIKECIIGVDKPECIRRDRENSWKRERFLYFIINNTESGLDVDKLDYYQRDCKAAGIQANDAFDELLDTAMVMECADGVERLAYPDKYYENVFDAFRIRFDLHHKVYQHRVVKAVEYMLVDALIAAHDHFTIRGTNNKRKKLMECLNEPPTEMREGKKGDLAAYTRLNDSVWTMIQNESNPKLRKAQALLSRIENRDIYRCIGGIPLPEDVEKQMKDAKERGKKNGKGDLEIFEQEEKILSEICRNTNIPVGKLRLCINNMHHGKKEKNPVDEIYFYKKNGAKAQKVDSKKYDNILPKQFIDKQMKIYVTERKYGVEARNAFTNWCTNKGSTSPTLSFSQSQAIFYDRYNNSSSSSMDDGDDDGGVSDLFEVKKKKKNM